jgi:N-acyl-L-homoserine lactone synthetase
MSSPLAVVDAVAARLVARAAPVRFAIADTPAEREATYRLRYEVVIERGWARPEDLPDGLERDPHDDRAVAVLAWAGAAPAGANRLVFPAAGYRLPTEDTFDLEIDPRGQVVDWSRTIVATVHADRQHRLLLGLLGWSWLETRARGFEHVCGIFTPAVLRLYGRLGLRFRVLGPVRRHWGEERYPVRFDVPASAQTLSRWLAHAPEPTAPS